MKYSVSTLALCAAFLGGPVLAADLPSRKAPPPPTYVAPAPIASWTGLYVGLNAGGAFGGSQSAATNAWDLFDAPGTAAGAAFATSATGRTHAPDGGFIGGGQVGYNFQFGNVVAGLETDIQGTTASGSGTSTGLGADPAGTLAVTTTQVHKSTDYLGTVRGRVGYLVTPTLLLYGTGGLAYGGVNLSSQSVSTDAAGLMPSGFGSSSVSGARIGYAAGGGVEWLFTPSWSAKVEYLRYDLGSVTAPGSAAEGVAAAGVTQWAFVPSTSARFDGNIVRAGLNYHFNWGAAAPVSAKY